MTLAADEVGEFQVAGARGRGDDDVREQRTEHELDVVQRRELLDDLGTALGVGAVVLDDELDRAPADAAGLVDVGDGGVRDALVPAPVGRADAGAVRLEAEPEGGVGRPVHVSAPERAERQGGERTGGGRAAEQAPAGRGRDSRGRSPATPFRQFGGMASVRPARPVSGRATRSSSGRAVIGRFLGGARPWDRGDRGHGGTEPAPVERRADVAPDALAPVVGGGVRGQGWAAYSTTTRCWASSASSGRTAAAASSPRPLRVSILV